MKALVIKSNHGNHRGFNRKWTILAEFNNREEAQKFLYDYLLRNDLTDEDGETDTSYDGRHYIVVDEGDELLFDGGGYGYASREMAEFLGWE